MNLIRIGATTIFALNINLANIYQYEKIIVFFSDLKPNVGFLK